MAQKPKANSHQPASVTMRRARRKLVCINVRGSQLRSADKQVSDSLRPSAT